MGSAVAALVLVALLGAAFLGRLGAVSWFARAVVRLAALCWHSELDSPDVLAEEWQALINQRPAAMLKVATALTFLTGAVCRRGMFAARPFVRDSVWVLGRLAAGYVRVLRVLLLSWDRHKPRRGARLAAGAVLLFLLGAVFGHWALFGPAALLACVSRSFTRIEKWLLVIVIPVATALLYTAGFWLNRAGYPGGHKGSAADVLSGAASFFGTLPRTAALLGALFLAWRLARHELQGQT